MKKRLISMVLALSMMLSLCPAAAFADTGIDPFADTALLAAVEPTAALEFQNGRPLVTDQYGHLREGVRLSIDTAALLYIYEGRGWRYQIPYTQDGSSVDFSDRCTLVLTEDANLNGTILAPNVDVVVSDGTLKNATINGDLTIGPNGRVENVTCNGTVHNEGTIGSGDFNGEVTNDGTIEDGKFTDDVTNNGTIKDGTFTDNVTNNGTIQDGDFSGDVTNNGKVDGGNFSGKVDNNTGGSITDGNFSGDVANDGKVDGGNFSGGVSGSGTVSSGVFADEPGKRPDADKIDRNTVQSTVQLYNGQSFSANSLQNVKKLLVLGKQTITLSAFVPLTNVYRKAPNGTESWNTLTDNTLTVQGGSYVLNLPERTAGDFRYDPANRTVTWPDGSSTGLTVSYYGPDDPSHKAKDITSQPGRYVIKVSAPGSSEWMEVTDLTDASWAFTVDPLLTFDEAKITATRNDNGQPLYSGDRVAVGTSITLEATAEDFVQWSISGVSGLTQEQLTEASLTFTVQNSNIIASLNASSSNNPGGGDAVLGTALGVASGAALYYLGTTTFLRIILPQDVALPKNREELATALWILFGREEPANTTEFVDVDADDPNLKAIRWMLDQGAMTATVREDGAHFMPLRYTTRTESILTWYRVYCKRDRTQNNNAS